MSERAQSDYRSPGELAILPLGMGPLLGVKAEKEAREMPWPGETGAY
jgi:hypothetical protein